MSEFLTSVLDTVTVLLDFILSGIQTAVSFIVHIPDFMLWVKDMISLLPAPIAGFALLSVSLSTALMFVSFIRVDNGG